MNFYPIYRNKKLLPWIKWWLIKGNKVAPKHLSEWINSAQPITLTGAYKGSPLLFLNLNGNTSQTGTPTPEAPVPVNVVKGNNTIKINDTDYQVNLKSKNLFDKSTVTNGYYLNESGGLTANGNYCVSDYIQITEGETYYIPTRGTSRTKFYTSSKTAYSNTWDVTDGSKNFIVPSGVSYIRISISISGGTAVSLDTFMFNLGTTALPYEPYYDYELCKIGNYQDRIYYEGGKWYVDKYIEKVVLNGGESWSTRTGGTTYAYTLSNFFDSSNREGLCDYFKYVRAGASSTQNTECVASAGTNKTLNIFTNNTSLDTVANLKTWLSTHNTSVYYVLAESTTTEITETTLLSQLEAIYNCKLNSGTNTITQTPSDLPFYLNFRYYEKG